MSRPKQESEVRYRIVVDTVIPPSPYPATKSEKDEWQEKYGCIYLLKAYEGRDFSSLTPIKALVTTSKKGGRYHGYKKFSDKSEFDFHIEKSEVVWDWVDVDLQE